MSKAPENPIWGKILQVRAAVQSAGKSGKNEKQNYKYTTEADAFQAVRDEMDKAGIGCHFHATSTEFVENVLYLHGFYTVYDAEGHSIDVPWIGEGEPPGKRLYKAYTGASKYFHLKFFGLYTEDDPENDSKDKPKAPVNTAKAKELVKEAQKIVEQPTIKLEVDGETIETKPGDIVPVTDPGSIKFVDEETVFEITLNPIEAGFNDDKLFLKGLGAKWSQTDKTWKIYTVNPDNMKAELAKRPHINYTYDPLPF